MDAFLRRVRLGPRTGDSYILSAEAPLTAPGAAEILHRAVDRLPELEHAGTVRMSGRIVGAERRFVKANGTLSTGEGARERTLLVRLHSER
ncbi:hypothetical protein [Nocardiopsis salina]|uniref:hypothetical protein n=1 Tax=Nocardiopsis salina TaxID=245836 RepID=UPI001267EE42|nr:hypothetical protein [Nocardiopsis salina]